MFQSVADAMPSIMDDQKVRCAQRGHRAMLPHPHAESNTAPRGALSDATCSSSSDAFGTAQLRQWAVTTPHLQGCPAASNDTNRVRARGEVSSAVSSRKRERSAIGELVVARLQLYAMLHASLTSAGAGKQDGLRARLEEEGRNMQESMNKQVTMKLMEVEMQLDSVSVRARASLGRHRVRAAHGSATPRRCDEDGVDRLLDSRAGTGVQYFCPNPRPFGNEVATASCN
jgi:hypothetical protein